MYGNGEALIFSSKLFGALVPVTFGTGINVSINLGSKRLGRCSILVLVQMGYLVSVGDTNRD
jgi:hypothetical protein